MRGGFGFKETPDATHLHPNRGLIWINARRLGGTPCFTGSRVPIKTLFDHLASGQPLDKFLIDFEGISREHAEAVIALAGQGLLEHLPRA